MIKSFSARHVSKIALLAALLSLTGMLKIPSFFPGAEFQLSSPLSVAICAVYGFKLYFLVGILSSVIGIVTGIQSVLNVVVALVFRITVGLIVAGSRGNSMALLLAGPIGTISARFCLAWLINTSVYPLVLAALPGMIYTAALVRPLTKMLQRVRNNV